MEENKQIVELNVGGRLFTTSVSTLKKEKSSKLSEMFEKGTQIMRDKNGRVFIDFNGEVFEYVLNYLRNGSIPTKERALEVHECAEYFGISTLVDALKLYQPVARGIMMSEIKKTFAREQYEELKQHAVAELNDKFHPKEDKYLTVVNSTQKCACVFQENGKTYMKVNFNWSQIPSSMAMS